MYSKLIMHFLVTSYENLCQYIIHTEVRGNTDLKTRNWKAWIFGRGSREAQ